MGATRVGMENHHYIRALKSSHIRITEREDETVWKHVVHGVYTPKLGYIYLNIDIHHRDPC